ncbi:hypothetical protein [Harryflintia acetispora]|uniref:hypothetical protein n=1 Tax=Harryflintia acetispora TaxID=1849041 RepID=UPI00189AC21F|nr:hypothetical protein [Harryflintia acetispora]
MDGATIAMFVFQTVVTAIVGIAAWGVKNAIAEIRTAISRLEEANKANNDRIDEVQRELNDLKADLPLVYTLREDFIRILNNVDTKLDRILNEKGRD